MYISCQLGLGVSVHSIVQAIYYRAQYVNCLYANNSTDIIASSIDTVYTQAVCILHVQ